MWLSGVLTTGELFLWNKDQDCLKMIQVTEKPKEVIKATVGRDVLILFDWKKTEMFSYCYFDNVSVCVCVHIVSVYIIFILEIGWSFFELHLT